MAALTRTRTGVARARRWMRPSLLTPAARSCREHFLAFSLMGSGTSSYVQDRASLPVDAHREWVELLNREPSNHCWTSMATTRSVRRGLRIESHTNLLFLLQKWLSRTRLPIRWARTLRNGTARFDLRLGPASVGASNAGPTGSRRFHGAGSEC